MSSVNIYVSPELKAEMEKRKLNWSRIAANAFKMEIVAADNASRYISVGWDVFSDVPPDGRDGKVAA